MDPQTLAQQIVPVLAPVLPYLVKAGEQAAWEVGKIAAGVAGEKIKTLWGRIWSKMDSKPAAQEAVQELVKTLMMLTRRVHFACNYVSSSPMMRICSPM